MRILAAFLRALFGPAPTNPAAPPAPRTVTVVDLTSANLPRYEPAGPSTVQRICEVLAASRDPSNMYDPTYYDRKAEVFDAIAAEEEYDAIVAETVGHTENGTWRRARSAEARKTAAQARRRAAELRGRS